MSRDFSDERIQALLLRKMYRKRCFGRRHISESNLPKGFPSHLYKRVLETANNLRKRGLLVKHPTHHDAQWYLNIKKIEEIKKIIKKFYPVDPLF